MKKMGFWKIRYDNTVDALIPEHWANEALFQLENNMVMGNLVYRDYSNMVASYGDVVNAHKPAAFDFKRKGTTDDVSVQNAVATNIPVALNQHGYVSFMIRDAEMSWAFKDLVSYFLTPAMRAMANGIDKTLIGLSPQFLPSYAGRLGSLSTSNAKDYVIAARKIGQDAGWLQQGRNLVIDTTTEATLLGVSEFTKVNEVGTTDGVKRASLGTKFGFDIFMDQNTPYIASTSADTRTAAVNNGSGYAVGATSIAIDGITAAIAPTCYVTFGTSKYPYRLVSSTENTGLTTSTLVLATGLRDALLNDGVVTIYDPCYVDLSAGYVAGWTKEIHVDGFTSGKAPQVGQIAAIGSAVYTIIGVTNVVTSDCDILLDRPLDALVANDAEIDLGPAGSYNLAFMKGAIALVSRPLALPPQGTGVRGAVVNYNGFAMRVVMTYNGSSQGTLVTVDCLYGVKILDSSLGCVMLG